MAYYLHVCEAQRGDIGFTMSVCLSVCLSVNSPATLRPEFFTDPNHVYYTSKIKSSIEQGRTLLFCDLMGQGQRSQRVQS